MKKHLLICFLSLLSVGLSMAQSLTREQVNNTITTNITTNNNKQITAATMRGVLQNITANYFNANSDSLPAWRIQTNSSRRFVTDAQIAQWNAGGGGGGGGNVSSVFGRIGAITAQAGDYNASQITDAATLSTNQIFVGPKTFTSLTIAGPYITFADGAIFAVAGDREVNLDNSSPTVFEISALGSSTQSLILNSSASPFAEFVLGTRRAKFLFPGTGNFDYTFAAEVGATVASRQWVSDAKYTQITTTSYTLSAADNNRVLVFTNAGNITVTVPQALTGFSVGLVKGNTGNVIVSPAAGVTILSRGGLQSITAQYSSAQISSYFTTNTYHLLGDLQ